MEIRRVSDSLGNNRKIKSDYKLVRSLIKGPYYVVSDSGIQILLICF